MPHTPSSALASAIWYARLAIVIEIVGFGIYWVALYIATLALDARFLLSSLVLPGIHFIAPFTGIEMLHFYDTEWVEKGHAPNRHTVGRWVAQIAIPLLSDVIALSDALLLHVPELQHLGLYGMATAYALFHVLLAASTLILVIVALVIWRAMVAGARSTPHLRNAEHALLDGLRQ